MHPGNFFSPLTESENREHFSKFLGVKKTRIELSLKPATLIRFLKITLTIFKIITRSIWMSYQIVLGISLVLLIWYGAKALNYIHWFDIQELREERPLTTSFIEYEKQRIQSDSLLFAEVNKSREKYHQEGIIWQEWLPLDSIPQLVRELVIIAEDGKFYEHSGFDLEQIEYALVSNHQKGKKARGASTISQQVIKNLFLSGDKTYSRKIREAVMTKLMEEVMGKDKILEIYLNIAQFGPGIFGVKAGSQYHFNKPLDSLSLEESISLVALLPSPLKWNPHKQNSTYRKHRMRVLRNLSLYKKIANTIPDDMQELFKKYAEEEEEIRWSKLRTGPYTGGDSLTHMGDNSPLPDTTKERVLSSGKGSELIEEGDEEGDEERDEKREIEDFEAEESQE